MPDASPGLECPILHNGITASGTTTCYNSPQNLHESTGHRQRHSAIRVSKGEPQGRLLLLAPFSVCPSCTHQSSEQGQHLPTATSFPLGLLQPHQTPGISGQAEPPGMAAVTGRANEPSQASGQPYNTEILQSLQKKLCIRLK